MKRGRKGGRGNRLTALDVDGLGSSVPTSAAGAAGLILVFFDSAAIAGPGGGVDHGGDDVDVLLDVPPAAAAVGVATLDGKLLGRVCPEVQRHDPPEGKLGAGLADVKLDSHAMVSWFSSA